MATLRIPKYAYNGLRIILTLDDPTFELLLETVSTLPPTAYLKAVDDRIQRTAKLPEESVREIIKALLVLYNLRADSKMPVPEFALAMREAITDQKIIENVTVEQIQTRMVRLLGFEDSFGVTTKAQNVLNEYEHVLCSVRILSDVRAVFPEPLGTPLGAAIVHNLKISYHEGTELKEFFVAMDGNDVKRLRFLLERAEQKAEHLKNVLKAATVNYLED